MYARLHFFGFCASQTDLHNAIFAKYETGVALPFLSQIFKQIITHVLHLEHEYIGILFNTKSYVVDDALLPSQTLAVGFG